MLDFVSVNNRPHNGLKPIISDSKLRLPVYEYKRT